MPYAAHNQVSKSPIDGGIEITDEQYRDAVAGMAQGKVVRIDNGFEVRDKPQPTTYWLSAGDRRQTEPGEDVPAEATTEPPPDRHHDLTDGEWVINLDRLESDLLRQIDAKSSEVRERYLTSGTGQSAVYITKFGEARAYKGATDPVDADYPYLNAEATRRGVAISDLADEVIATREAWTNPAGATIEAERVGGKADVRAAISADDKRTAADDAIAALDAIKPQ